MSVDNINPVIQAPIKKGDVLGYREYERNGAKLGKIELVASSNIERIQNDSEPPKTAVKEKNSFLTSILKAIAVIFIGFLVMRVLCRFISRYLKARKHSNLYNNRRRYK